MKRSKLRDFTYSIFRLGENKFRPRRDVKDRLFRFIFETDKEALLQLYNALNHTDYCNPAELEILTIQNVIYMTMKNDLAFAIAGVLNLYEQQSTFTPNMPVRFFIYLGDEFQKIIAKRGMEKLYSSTLIKLPTPKCVVFYNGTRREPEECILRLSDAYEQPQEEPDVELKVRFLNINFGYNKTIMESCHRLWEYSSFVHRVNEELQTGKDRKQAVQDAINYCIDHQILADILLDSKAEVMGMILSEFNEKKYRKLMREEGYHDGYSSGYDSGYGSGYDSGYHAASLLCTISPVRKKYQAGKSLETIAAELESDVDTIKPVYEMIAKYPQESDRQILERLSPETACIED